jgi:hypothetical protein
MRYNWTSIDADRSFGTKKSPAFERLRIFIMNDG